MPVSPTYPGVYVQEVPSGVRTIAGVSTSITLFIGRTDKGPLFEPVRCLSYTDFSREFGDGSAASDMARYAKLFYLNGGSDAYFLRIADGASAASVTLQNEAGTEVLQLSAKAPGVAGESIRSFVSYGGLRPEATFNIKLFRWVTDGAGRQTASEIEEWKNLSMDPLSPLYAPDFLTQESKLVDAAVAGAAPAAANGYSQSGRPVPFTVALPSTLRTAWEALIGDDPAAVGNAFQISVDGGSYAPVDLSGIDVGSLTAASLGAFATALSGEIQTAVQNALTAAGQAGVTVSVDLATDGPTAVAAEGDATSLLRITSDNAGSIFIRPASANDIAVALMLGAEQGGLEVGAHAARRPAPNGISLRLAQDGIWQSLAELQQDAITTLTLGGTAIPVDLQTSAAAEPLYRDAYASGTTGNNDGLREKLALLRDAVNAHRAANTTTFFWSAELAGSRLTFVPLTGADNDIGTLVTAPFALSGIPNSVGSNSFYSSVGIAGTAGLQSPAISVAQDGNPPTLADYERAMQVADREVDLFNIMVLPPDRAPAVAMSDLWGPASVFCQQRRAFLLMDAPTTWDSAQTASTEVAGLRVGLVKDHSAIYFPRLTVNDAGLRVNVGPTGAIAGLMARTDASRGVWKAPAGTEADLRGVVGLGQRLSDPENGITNPRAVNTIRAFPNGIINWGARTMDGDDDFGSEWKYVPVRRLALYIEESLYRGLKWAVFEPNDEPLWSQIRLNVGAFMHNLFRQGAFQGQKPKDAYFVRCDSETTTQNDRNLGIVNIWVGFAPLKPAEFVVLYLQQMAGQIEV